MEYHELWNNEIMLVSVKYSGGTSRYYVNAVGEVNIKDENGEFTHPYGRPGMKVYPYDHSSSVPRDLASSTYAREVLRMESPVILHETWNKDRYLHVLMDSSKATFEVVPNALDCTEVV